jgi:hypothetical protein
MGRQLAAGKAPHMPLFHMFHQEIDFKKKLPFSTSYGNPWQSLDFHETCETRRPCCWPLHVLWQAHGSPLCVKK